eukprot:COSAG02_NODE_5557_length_4231_cov_1.573572_1_plen_221_part_00
MMSLSSTLGMMLSSTADVAPNPNGASSSMLELAPCLRLLLSRKLIERLLLWDELSPAASAASSSSSTPRKSSSSASTFPSQHPSCRVSFCSPAGRINRLLRHVLLLTIAIARQLHLIQGRSVAHRRAWPRRRTPRRRHHHPPTQKRTPTPTNSHTLRPTSASAGAIDPRDRSKSAVEAGLRPLRPPEVIAVPRNSQCEMESKTRRFNPPFRQHHTVCKDM